MREIKTKLYCSEFRYHPSRGSFTSENQRWIETIEKEKVEPFWSYYKMYNPERLLRQFMDTTDDKKKWDLIPAEQYHALLKRYMENPIAARTPDSLVSEWIFLICKNLAQVISIEKLYSRTDNFPYDVFWKIFGEQPDELKYIEPINWAMGTLHETGFYEWAVSPWNRPAWNDWGFPKVYKILKEYKEDMDPGDKLVLVNRCIDVVHGRGPMAEYFIEGGAESCDAISNS